MGSTVASDFNLDSNGHCFFCSHKIPVKVKIDQESTLGAPLFQKYSVHYLARYLEMDMGKVLNDEGQVDSSLLTKVRKSRLKVELCEKCTGLNSNFSRLCRQLEKLEMEINSSLKLIHEELVVAADRSEKEDTISTNFRSPMRNEISQILAVVREEAIQKSSQKLRVISPRVEMEKLTKKQIDAEILKHPANYGTTKMGPDTSSFKKSVDFQGNVKMEFEHKPQNEDVSLVDYDSRNEDMDDDLPKNDDDDDPWISVNDNNTETANNKNLYRIISTGPTNKVGKRNYSINPETGKWKCSGCPMEFTSKSGVYHHYNSVHLKIRYKCIPCGKEFGLIHNYKRHHQSVHAGVKFKCLVCNRLFTQKGHLQTHQRKTGCGIE